jgi:hypothetical protein
MLPLAGIELLALVVGLYCACWKMNFRQLIQIAPDKLSLTDGHYHPRRRWELDIGGRRSRPPQDSARASLINSVTLQALRRVWPLGAVVQEGWLPFKRL